MLAGVCLVAGAAALPAQAPLADSLTALSRRKAELTTELADVNRAIDQLKKYGIADPNQVIITSFGIDEVNAVGGVEPYFYVRNPGATSAIKYVVVTMVPYNAVGDRVRSSIGGEVAQHLRFTGPVNPGDEPQKAGYDPAWYNATVTCVKISEVTATWMSGRTATYAGPTLRKILAADQPNTCP
jgi:hypothetical protein